MTIRDNDLNLLIIFDNVHHLPFIIRSFEDHAIYGLSTSDLQLFNYTTGSGVRLPQRHMIIYNNDAILEDVTIDNIIRNPHFAADYFSGLTSAETDTSPAAPAAIQGYASAEIGEYWSNTFWSGEYAGTYGNVSVTTPASSLPGAHLFLVRDNTNLEQLILEFEDSVVVFEAPPHQIDLVIRWVKEHIGKPITHFWPSHHHHDHNYEVRQYVALGAKIIVPEVSASYWTQIPKAQLAVYSENKPYIVSDSHMQARFIWHSNAGHAIDWSYSIVTSRCPSNNDTILAYVADAWSTSFAFDDGFAYNWLDQARDDGLSKNTLVVPAHGSPTPLSVLLGLTGHPYPNHNTTSFKSEGSICLK